MSSLEPEAGPSRASSLHAEEATDQKGKRRLSHGRGPLLGDSDDDSIADERTALLPQKSAASRHQRRAKWWRISLKRVLCGLVIVIVMVTIALLITLHVLLGHLYHRRLNDPDRLQRYGERALVVDDPQSVSINSIDDTGIHARVRIKAGVDVRRAFDGEMPLDWVERNLLKKGLAFAPRARVNFPADVFVTSLDGLKLARLPAESLMSFTVPLRWQPQGDWLEMIDLPLDIRLEHAEDLAAFVNASWTAKRADVRVQSDNINVQIGGPVTWKKSMGVARNLGLDVPALPGLEDPSKLVDLQSYAISPLINHQLGLNAIAIAKNPLSHASLPPMLEHLLKRYEREPLDMPWRLPFSVGIKGVEKSEIPMARVDILPFGLEEESDSSNAALSTFLARFLLGLDNPVVVRYATADAPHRAAPPAFLGSLLKPYLVQLRFPGAPDDERKLLRDVKIEDMHISLGDGSSDLMASGRVVGELKLPHELAGLAEAEALAIKAVMPDIYVYDGAAPPSRDKGSVPGDGRPPASNAFARLRSDTFLPATTVRQVTGKNGTVTLVRAELKDAPLDLLPGRSDVFRRYMTKVLFGSGDGPDGKVKTGIKGIVAVNATIEGFGHVELNGLPVEGEFYMGRSDASRSLLRGW